MDIAEDELHKATRSSAGSIAWLKAWESGLDVRPVGVPKQRRLAPSVPNSRQTTPASGGGQGSGGDMRKYCAQRKEELAAIKKERMDAAAAGVTRLSDFGNIPITRVQVSKWVSDNVEEFLSLIHI